ncbi:MAG TPA: hypothetical protein P5075_10715 [Eubacteriales bacterium]|nr:hypothetical protein [Eubacteriales bacterium]
MSYISEKVAYLDGLADGLSLKDEGTDKVLRGVIDTLGAIAEALEEQDETLEDLSDCVDGIYDELDELEDAFDYDGDEDADDFIEVECPHCGETVYFDEDMIDSDDGLICPFCNEVIEFDIPCCGEEDEEGGEDE